MSFTVYATYNFSEEADELEGNIELDWSKLQSTRIPPT
jgi:hypothetical protein